MQELILDKGLRSSEKDAEIRNVARARTLAVVRSLDGDRKGQVVRFLHEAELIGNVEEQLGERRGIEAIIDLHTANLTGANLTGADLGGAYLERATLSGATECTNEQLAQARSLVGATLPDGRVIITEEDWEKFKKRYRAGG